MNCIDLDLDKDELEKVKAGSCILLNGTIYSARDAAHKKIKELLEKELPMPINFRNKVIYYMGPTPTRLGNAIGSCGPTSSYRMDDFLEMTLKLGVIATIGKGSRSPEVNKLAKRFKVPYLLAVGGAGAYLAKCVTAAKTVLFEELGAEAIMELSVRKFPVIVGIDAKGNQAFL